MTSARPSHCSLPTAWATSSPIPHKVSPMCPDRSVTHLPGSNTLIPPPTRGRGMSLVESTRHQIVVGREQVDADDVEEFLEAHMLVGGAHAVGEGAVDIGGDVAVAPEAGVGAAQAHDRLRAEAAKGLDVFLDDADHGAVGRAIGRRV